ncbi:esterase/lipase family protein [Sphingomonas hankookensis]|uniref:esterase/lipase family protein n=1 Tax=Sphingomonas hankookensis TaxID=563996 RepID=UPI003F79AD5C
MIETPRAALALAGVPFGWRAAIRGAPRAAGEPVMLLPGLFNGDRSNAIMARYLRALGHDARGWALGRNVGQRSIGADGGDLFARIDAIAQGAGRPVALVGISLGGIMARLAAHRRPDLVEQVVTVASPYAGPARSTRVWRLYEWISGEIGRRSGGAGAGRGGPPPLARPRDRDLERQRRAGQRAGMPCRR